MNAASATDILNQYGGLGMLSINGKDISVTHYPKLTNYNDVRLPCMVKWLNMFMFKHNCDNTLNGNYFFTVFDGFREHTEPSLTGRYKRLRINDLHKYGKLLFTNPNQLKEDYPLLPHPVIAYGRHKNDYQVIRIPNHDFIVQNGFQSIKKEIKICDKNWNLKENVIYWRGGNHGSKYRIYDSSMQYNQRELAVNMGKKCQDICNIKFDRSTEKSEFLNHKYLLDIDGMVNAWSGLFWKLSSNSLVLKVESHFEEWYYDYLIPYYHYIPIKGDLSDLIDQFKWLQNNENSLQQIVENAGKFVNDIDFEFSIENDGIKKEFVMANTFVNSYPDFR